MTGYALSRLGRRRVPQRASHTFLDFVVRAGDNPTVKAATGRMRAYM